MALASALTHQALQNYFMNPFSTLCLLNKRKKKKKDKKNKKKNITDAC